MPASDSWRGAEIAMGIPLASRRSPLGEAEGSREPRASARFSPKRSNRFYRYKPVELQWYFYEF
ncbi:MAG: hypothetical protein A2Z72_05785 [Omnitrophica bacterium RBG_13_46_9]|nr:MAG: hypothetical protein A2Z72_05785 [Omnitrophica bacterium RBG_13_46_9]